MKTKMKKKIKLSIFKTNFYDSEYITFLNLCLVKKSNLIKRHSKHSNYD